MKKYDGCSGGMSTIWRKVSGSPPPWEGCCDIHDQPYAVGGTKEERLVADKKLMHCVAKKGHSIWAVLMFVGVRIGGVPWLPTPWRWGFETDNKWYTKEK